MNRIEKELDVVSFIRKQIKVSIALQKIFETRGEKARLRNDDRFTLDESISEGSDEETRQAEYLQDIEVSHNKIKRKSSSTDKRKINFYANTTGAHEAIEAGEDFTVMDLSKEPQLLGTKKE